MLGTGLRTSSSEPMPEPLRAASKQTPTQSGRSLPADSDLLDVLLILAPTQAPELSQWGISLGPSDEPIVTLKDVKPLIRCAAPVLATLIGSEFIAHIDSPLAEADSSFFLSRAFPTRRWSGASQAVLRPGD